MIALGAILRYATNLNVEGISIDTVGLILMIAGAVGLILGLFQELVWSGRQERREEENRRAAQEQQAAAQQQGNPPPPPRY